MYLLQTTYEPLQVRDTIFLLIDDAGTLTICPFDLTLKLKGAALIKGRKKSEKSYLHMKFQNLAIVSFQIIVNYHYKWSDIFQNY